MKSRYTAAIFAFLLGGIGINNFYTNNNTKGIVDCLVSILLCWTIIAPLTVSIINLVRGCKYLWCDTDEQFNIKFVKN